MPPEAVKLRRATRVALVAGAATLLGLVVLFGAVLHPVVPERCTTGLYPGAYADALVPAHLLALLVLAGAAIGLATACDGLTPALRRAAACAGAAVLAGGAIALLPVLFVVMVVLVPLAVFALAVLGVLRSVATARTAGLDSAERWRRHARVAEAALWVALVLVLPAVFAAAWLNGAGLFCF